MGLFDWLKGGAPEPVEPVAPGPPTEADILASLDRVTALVEAEHASPLIRSRVARVDSLVRATLPRLAHLGLGSLDAYAVVATATDYLPEAVGGYLRLPREWADSRPIEGGRTALMILIDQLELLASTMAKMLDAATRADAQALIAHGRFLEAKFGPSSTGGMLDASGVATGTLAPPAASEPVTAPPPAPTAPARPASPLDLESP